LPWRDTHIIVIDVSLSNTRPHFLTHKGIEASTYVRVGSSNRLADRALIESLRRSINVKTFDEEPLYEAKAEEIDLNEIERIFKPFREITNADLQTLGVIIKDQSRTVPSIGGVLLFSKDRFRIFPDSWIQAGHFAGIDKAKILDTRDINGSLPALIHDSVLFIRKHISVGLKIEGIHSEEEWSIPEAALREAIVNAIVHTDYSLVGAPIRISIFDDRIEIQNPGLLLPGLTIDDITSGFSKIRNRVIARVFREIKLIEQWGSGIQRIVKSCAEAGLEPPIFEEIGYNFRVTFSRNKLHPAYLDEVDKNILQILQEGVALSTNEIAQMIGLSVRSVRPRLIKLIQKGKVLEFARSKKDPHKKYTLNS